MTDRQTDRQTDGRTDARDKNNMSPDPVGGRHNNNNNNNNNNNRVILNSKYGFSYRVIPECSRRCFRNVVI